MPAHHSLPAPPLLHSSSAAKAISPVSSHHPTLLAPCYTPLTRPSFAAPLAQLQRPPPPSPPAVHCPRRSRLQRPPPRQPRPLPAPRPPPPPLPPKRVLQLPSAGQGRLLLGAVPPSASLPLQPPLRWMRLRRRQSRRSSRRHRCGCCGVGWGAGGAGAGGADSGEAGHSSSSGSSTVGHTHYPANIH